MAKRILVVDDSSSIRQAVSVFLKASGYEVVEASNGQEALDKLDGTAFDLFVCDVNMPVMTGIEFLRTIKEDDTYSDYRYSGIIMLTTETGDDMISEGKKLGAKAWIIKPFQPKELLEKIKMITG